jgi:N-acetylglutamate synthase-like GNAT family acetyltransferase
MIHNKWIRNDEKNKEVESLKNIYLDKFLAADFNNMFSYNLVIFDNKKPVALGRLEMRSGLFVITGIGVDEENKNIEIYDLVIRFMIRKASDMGAQGIYVKPEKERIDFYKDLGFQLANKNFHEEEMYYRHGDIEGDCCGE